MSFKYGKKSLLHMQGVKPNMVELAKEAIKISPVDSTVLSTGGLRTASMQHALFVKGASKRDGRNTKSLHQKQADGFGHALDLVPWVAGDPRWEWPLIYPIAASMAMKAREMEIELKWGGVWDRTMNEIIGGVTTFDQIAARLQDAVSKYCIRHAGPDFIDGPHYQLV